MSHFLIRCRKCGKTLKEVYCAFCEHCSDALLITDYLDKHFSAGDSPGIWKFNWLPVHTPFFDQNGPVVYKSEGLADALGLENLFVVFNGFWPEKGALLETCTFKEFEAAVVIQNAQENGIKGLIVASAGNTARAFSHLSKVAGFPVIIVVPRMCLVDMWYLETPSEVTTLAVTDGDYSDSIDVARRIASTTGFPFEGGVKNIAKRDGLGLVLLEAVSKIGSLPDHYFQAVGSGTGAVGIWEMSERFLLDGRYGDRLPTLHLAQNMPFAPMVKAWSQNSRALFPEDLKPELISRITTRVLSTRYPAYAINGGVYDALKAANGSTYGIENPAVYEAMDLFRNTEGIDIVPAAGVAVAALQKAVSDRKLKADDVILLNITGGGEGLLRNTRQTFAVEPYFISRNITETEIEWLLSDITKL